MWAESVEQLGPLRTSCLQWPFFTWVNPLFARRGDIEHTNLPRLDPSDRTVGLTAQLEAAWEASRKSANGDGKALRKAFFDAFGWQYIPWGLTNSGWAFTGEVDEGVGLAIALAACSAVAALCHHLLFFWNWRWGMRWRSAIMMAVFRKAMRATLPAVSRGGGPGSLVNILSSDTEVFQKLSQFLVFVLVGWMEVIGSCVLLYREMGPASLAGIAVLLVMVPIQGWFGRIFKRLRTHTAAATDERVRAMRQVVAGIKAIKVAAWELPMHGRLQRARAAELELVQQASAIRAANEGIFTVVPVLMGAATFLTRWGTGGSLTARSVFACLSLFQLLQLMVKFFLLAIEATAEGSASMARLERFMALPEVAAIEDARRAAASPAPVAAPEPGAATVWAKDLVATWSEVSPAGDVSGLVRASADEEQGGDAAAAPTPALQGVTLEARRGELHVVVGPVAAGKSTLLLSLLGECPQVPPEAAASMSTAGPTATVGGCGIRGLASYCPQEAWVVSGSLRQNVLLSRGTAAEKDGWEGERGSREVPGEAAPWLEARFRAAVDTTGLAQDAAAFEDGYDTMLGAQGKRASGGQKARVNLARAVLDPRTEAVLLDDPLSAVDARTGRRIMERCVQGLLLRRGPFADSCKDAHEAADALGVTAPPAVVLATHQLQWLPLADRVTVLMRGAVRASGTPAEVAAQLRAEGIVAESDGQAAGEPAGAAAAAGTAAAVTDGAAATASKLAAGSVSEEGSLDEESFLGSVLAAATGSVHAASEPTGIDDIVDEGGDGPDAAGSAAGPEAVAVAVAVGEADGKASATAEAPAGEAASSAGQAKGDAASTAVVPVVAPKRALEEKEASSKGVVQWSTYWAYASAAAGPAIGAFIGLLFLVGSLLLLACSIFLSNWTKLTPAEQALPANDWFPKVYGGLVAVTAVVCVGRMWIFFSAAVSAGQKIHDKALGSVLGAPMRWFEQNPVGRVVSRFSKDLYLIDTLLPLTLEDFINVLTLILSAVVLVCVSNAWLLFAVLPLAGLLLWMRQYYLLTSREVQRLEAVSRSPIFRMLVECLDGLDSVRAYKLESLLGERMARIINWNMSGFFMFLTTSRWLGTRLDFICSIFLLAASLATVLVRDTSGVDPGLAGLSLSLVIQLTGTLQWCFRQSAMLEVQMVSVERLLELDGIPQEGVDVGHLDHSVASCCGCGCCGSCCAPPPTAKTALVVSTREAASAAVVRKASQAGPTEWPKTGSVEFRNVWLRYRPGLPHVLRGVSFGVPPGSLVGVVGRTGAGKTTLTAAMLRLVAHESVEEVKSHEGEGARLPDDAPKGGPDVGVVIGGDDIRKIHLTALRRGLAVIDQDPTLFAGTLRSNVDPFEDYTDEQILAAMTAVQMGDAAERRGGLGAPVEEGGANLSVGERQLLCLARAVLRHVHVQVYDEPTAFSDVRTDEKLQEALRTAAATSGSTVFTVAHRLRTVADHDLLVVMDAGRVVDFGSPKWLLSDEAADAAATGEVVKGPAGAWGFCRSGAFRSMVGQLSASESDAVRSLAASGKA
ncbi:hypothetical protein FNF31_00789 [Cafeteria roenbergensis]|uniref:ABC transporter domain-containing protein n=1 Tax=Cafeteria roenbergensis TaxID=33653 RepID=A0A5A8E1H8_CAFRO|nr:hypothetical protein FNF31_00789 [Cafeteria roenbergensis]KAA0171602.1 hypothetical protein FNF28_00535 [Cafeteria roenbergensis]